MVGPTESRAMSITEDDDLGEREELTVKIIVWYLD